MRLDFRKWSEFMSLSVCPVCQSRACTKKNDCDPHSQIDRAIAVCAQVCADYTAEELFEHPSFAKLGAQKTYFAYKAGEILAGKYEDE